MCGGGVASLAGSEVAGQQHRYASPGRPRGLSPQARRRTSMRSRRRFCHQKRRVEQPAPSTKPMSSRMAMLPPLPTLPTTAQSDSRRRPPRRAASCRRRAAREHVAHGWRRLLNPVCPVEGEAANVQPAACPSALSNGQQQLGAAGCRFLPPRHSHLKHPRDQVLHLVEAV